MAKIVAALRRAAKALPPRGIMRKRYLGAYRTWRKVPGGRRHLLGPTSLRRLRQLAKTSSPKELRSAMPDLGRVKSRAFKLLLGA